MVSLYFALCVGFVAPPEDSDILCFELFWSDGTNKHKQHNKDKVTDGQREYG